MGYQLRNDKLLIEIGELGDYNRTRFDWTGFINQVTLLEGGHTFCVPESLVSGQGTGGAGICNEFGITDPIGYEDARTGDNFLKIGIGLLTRESEGPYEFNRDYPLESCDFQVHQPDASSITFTVTPVNCRGYAVRMIKQISIISSKLHIKYSLENTGSLGIHTHEYAHNFLGIDKLPVGPEYKLRFPFAYTPNDHGEGTMEGLQFTDGEVRFTSEPEKEFFFQFDGTDTTNLPYLWELVHDRAGVGVRETSDYPIAYGAVWGKGHVISPEMFVKIDVEPGQTINWERTYEFFTK